jgi:diguanylate cyclase (GGDEF)-like protein/PAS domain S-box-containing protein
MAVKNAAIESPDCLLFVDPDREIVYASATAEAVLGWVPAELVGRSLLEVLPDLGQGPSASPVARALAGEEVLTYVTRRRRRDGALVNTVVSLRALRGARRQVVGLTAILRADGAELQTTTPSASPDEASQVRRIEEVVYKAILEATSEGIAVTGPTGTAVMSNGRLAELLGRDTAALARTDLHALLGLGPSTSDTDPVPQQHQSSYRHPGGSTRLLQVTRSALSTGGAQRWLLRVSDVTEARRAEDELRRLALHDPLTGLPNRQLAHDRLRMAAARLERAGDGSVGVIFLDLDGFKTINDSQGHEAGDSVLVEVARRLSLAVRSTDTVSRLGGDEFTIICEQADEAELLMVAQRIQEGLEQPINLANGRLVVRGSIGVALSPPHEVADLLRSADTAMYVAKAAGSGRISVAPPPPRPAAGEQTGTG